MMSVQFGRWNLDGKPVDHTCLDVAKDSISRYGLDGSNSYIKENASILYCAFHTTKESRRERQPHVMPSGAVLTLDGRLDNGIELAVELKGLTGVDATDVEIAAAAFQRWRTDCFARLLGDWALTVWDPITGSLLLAKDFLGARQLYYSIDKNRVTWSTILDPLVLLAGKSVKICEEYLAGWFAFYPAADLTPYVGIQCVPPSSFVLLRSGKKTVSRYWDFDPAKSINYATDAEYEEHFRAVFREAVRRRLRADCGIVAELSGGMDSSSIVCMADSILANEGAVARSFQTVSYYNDSEPNWNERPYFTKVEEKLGRTGLHINVGSVKRFTFDLENENICVTPACLSSRNLESNSQFVQFIQSRDSRVILSGIGGDEVMGGVPTAMPELQDLLSSGRIRHLAHQLKVWALNKREPWFHLLFEAIKEFLPLVLSRVPKYRRPGPWFDVDFVRRNKLAFEGYETRLRILGPRPSLQANILTLDQLTRQLSCQVSAPQPHREVRYPFLDRDLLEFAYYIPRGQLVRPGQRKSLMRRALKGLVPAEVLQRRRKAFVSRAPRAAIVAEWSQLEALTRHTHIGSMGIVNQGRFAQYLRKARQGEDFPLIPLTRTIHAEIWFQKLVEHGLFLKTDRRPLTVPTPLATEMFSQKHRSEGI